MMSSSASLVLVVVVVLVVRYLVVSFLITKIPYQSKPYFFELQQDSFLLIWKANEFSPGAHGKWLHTEREEL